MGSCVSTEATGDAESKRRSQAIDRKLEEDSRRLRRECKILLLGWLQSAHPAIQESMGFQGQLSLTVISCFDRRFWRERQVDHRQANENHPPKWLHSRRAGFISPDSLQEPPRLYQISHSSLSPVLTRTLESKSPRLHPIPFRLQH